MIAIIARHGKTRAGDIAILKADVFLGRPRPELAARLQQLDPVVPAMDLHALRALPPGTFGRSYVDFLDNNGLAPFIVSELTTPAVMARNLHWARYSLIHDMCHVLLDAGPDLVGEMKVYGFAIGQRYALSLAMFLPLVLVVMPLLAPHRTGAMIRSFRAGYALGRRTPCVMSQRLEDGFAQDLDEVRRTMGLSGRSLFLQGRRADPGPGGGARQPAAAADPGGERRRGEVRTGEQPGPGRGLSY
ncbi:MAG: Coq4 family protein [Myxococcota bacterium]